MTLNGRYLIKVPASSANLGPGFDSVGIAVDLYLTLEVEPSEKWEFIAISKELEQFPKDESHFIYQVAEKVASKYGKALKPCKVLVYSEIPLARGLGSSAAAIVAGIELADLIGELGLSNQEKLLFATELEGHPDNAGASLLGGLVVGCYQPNNQVDMVTFPDLPFEMVAVIPQEELLTKVAREVLPSVFSYQDAILASATSNLMIAALLSGNFEVAGKMMEKDIFHQPYRKPLIAFYEEIERTAKAKGAFGVALSGAGPTLLCFAEKGKGLKLTQLLQDEFSMMDVKLLTIENRGTCIKKLEGIM